LIQPTVDRLKFPQLPETHQPDTIRVAEKPAALNAGEPRWVSVNRALFVRLQRLNAATARSRRMAFVCGHRFASMNFMFAVKTLRAGLPSFALRFSVTVNRRL
jgi:hypothetical protein